ncbi:MAG TPA: hypothetical protein VN636_07045 [Acidimicrobiia bacterium]|nr:hypothetical protein [Acidimicrobiia bacterium]
MRSSTISMLIAGVLVGLGGIAIGIYVLLNHTGGKFWFYWIAPLLALGVGFVMLNLVVQYFVKVGRLELKGRPRK